MTSYFGASQICLFYTRHKNVSFFPKNLCVDIECPDIHVKYFFLIFLLFKMGVSNNKFICTWESNWISGDIRTSQWIKLCIVKVREFQMGTSEFYPC
jgi:hypothetical protein